MLTECGKITVKLDTGAEASVLPMKVYKKLKKRPLIDRTKTTLSAYGGSIIKPVGTCTLSCQSNGKSSTVMFYVVHIAAQSILGLADCVALGFIQRVHSLEVPLMLKETIQAEFGDIFNGLGKLGDYHVTLKEDATPVIHPPR